MKRIMYLAAHLADTSPVIQLYNMIKYLDPVKYESVVVSCFKERKDSIQEKFENSGIQVINLNLERWQLMRQQVMLRNIIRVIKPDLLHSCMIFVDGICLHMNLKIPWVITLHNYIYEDLPVFYGKILGNILSIREKKAIMKADIVVPCSYSLAQKYEKMISREFIPVQNGIETSIWKNDTGMTKRELRKKLRIPEDAFVFLFNGLLIARKDPMTVINAFKKAKLKNGLLIMMGDGDMEAECRLNAGKNVIFTGKVKYMKDYLYAADVVVSASKSEGLPYAILEAACTGVSLILSDIPQHLEIVGENFPKIFNLGDIDALAVLMQEAFDNDIINDDTAPYDMKNLTAEAMSKKYQKIYALALK